MKTQQTIKEMQSAYRPDEKFMALGPDALSCAELLAIILRTGSRGQTSVELAKSLLLNESSNQENILEIFSMDLEQLRKIRGIGTVKALQIKAVAELSGRIARTKKASSLVFTSPDSIAGYYMEQLRHLKREIVILLLLDVKCALLKEITLSQGTVNASLFSAREVFIEAVKYEASCFILLHNHPSGRSEPSKADIEVTKSICDTGSMLGISLLDHIIIGDNEYYSLKEKGHING